jgi:hypothetical protein
MFPLQANPMLNEMYNHDNRRTFKAVGFITIAMLCFVINALYAYSDSPRLSQVEVTPTFAPTKTPTLTPVSTTPEATEDSSVSLKFEISKPFTQKDLSVLTGNIQRPNGLAWHDNKLYASCSGDWTVYQVDAATGNTAQYIYGVKNAHTIYVTGDSDRPTLWIPDFQNNTLTHIVRGNTEIVASNLKGPWGITAWNDNEFVITNLLGNDLVSISTTGETKEMIQNLRSPTGVAIDGDYLYVANTGSARRAIEWYSLSDINARDAPLDSSDKSLNAILVTGLQNVTDVTMAADGYLYFGYALGTRGVVGRINPNLCRERGGCNNNEVEIVLYSELAAPLAGLVISPDMRLYIHSIFSPDIYWLQLNQSASDGTE